MSKTLEELAAARRAREIERLTTNLKGIPKTTPEVSPAVTRAIDGLQLSDLQFKSIDFFKAHPANAVFDRLKTPNYWRDLKRDISEAKAILDPVICSPDGTLIEGHSRIKIARELASEGLDLGKIPTLIVTSPITAAEVERRIYLGNLSRFEIDEDTRLALYSKIWPGWYKTEGPGPSVGGETVSPPLPTRAKTATDLGKSERQVKNDAALMREAEQEAKASGKTEPDIEDIRLAREKAKAKRRSKVLTKAIAGLRREIVVKLTASDVREIVGVLSAHPNRHRTQIITKLKKARSSK